MNILLASLALLPVSIAPARPAAPPPAQEAGPRSSSDVKDEIDRSIRWLCAQQDLESGSYGSVLETLAALEVLSTSPRKYRPGDGPFMDRGVAFLIRIQRADGAISDAATDPETVKRQTQMAIRVLKRLGGHPDVVEKAVGFVGAYVTGPEDPFAEEWLETIASEKDPATALLNVARALLATRHEDGSWDSEHGAVLATCMQLGKLISLQRTVAGLEPRRAGETHGLPAFDPADRARVVSALERGARFLIGASVDGKWGFDGNPDPGITAMTTGGLLAVPEPRPAEVQAAIERALDWLVSLQKPDGSIHAGPLANYVTSASVMALVRAGRAGDEPVIARARDYLRALQADEGEGYSPGDRFYGGVGYGDDQRPDLSNMQMALEALAESGLEKGDATFQKALAFLQRCQNRSESNDLTMELDGDTIVSGNDGGAGYAPGDSKAGYIELADGRKVPRSYGSMSYALLKGYLFAGLSKDDPRVQAVWSWLRKNYTLDVNPGFEASSDPIAPYQGLFYYFYTMAKALDLYGDETVTDAAGVAHPWRAELCGRLVSMQRQDGSWINDNAARWFEGNPVLATAYAMTTLGTALPAE